jgi:hypothetical protein
MNANHHVQDDVHYEPPYEPGAADLRQAASFVTEQFDCLSFLIEIPFKDNKNHIKPSTLTFTRQIINASKRT